MNPRLYLNSLVICLLLNSCASNNEPPKTAKQGQAKIDSLEAVLSQQTLADTNRALTLYNLSYYYSHVDTKRGLSYGEEALTLSQNLNFKRGIAGSYNGIGTNYLNSSDCQKAIMCFDSSIAIARQIGRKKALAANFRNRGIAKKLMRDFDGAEKDYYTSREIYEQIGDEEGVLGVDCNIGTIYLDSDQPDKALTFFERSIELAEKIDSRKNLAMIYNNCSFAYNMKGNYSKAKQFGMKALELGTELKDNFNLMLANKNIGAAHMQIGEHAQADYFFQESLKYANLLKSSDRRSQALRYIGENYLLASNKPESFTISREGSASDFLRIRNDSIEKICFLALAEVNPNDDVEIMKTLNVYADAQELSGNTAASVETRKMIADVKNGGDFEKSRVYNLRNNEVAFESTSKINEEPKHIKIMSTSAKPK